MIKRLCVRWLGALVLMGGLLMAPAALAQNTSYTGIQEAYDACRSWTDSSLATGATIEEHNCTQSGYSGAGDSFWPAGSDGAFTTTLCGSANPTCTTPLQTRHFFYMALCPGGVMDWDGNSCTSAEPPNECASKPALPSATVTVPTSMGVSNVVCVDGCQFYATAGAEIANGDGTKTFTGSFLPYTTGATCSAGTENFVLGSSAEGCVPSGSLSQCFNSATNQVCAVTPRGNKACWSLTETGTKVAPDQTESLAKSVPPEVPAAPNTLTNAETNTSTAVTASSQTSTTTAQVNITYANQTGEAGTGTTGGDSSGDASGSSPDGGNCDGSDDCTGAGQAGAGLGTGLYTGTGKTYGSVFATYISNVENAPIVAAATGFLVVDVATAGCPIIEVGPYEPYMPYMMVDAHCSGPFNLALVGAGFIILAGAALAAFRIAVL